jgi:hypothetical protein
MAKEQRPIQHYVSKKCPYCFVYMPLNAQKCFSCKKPVGSVDENGMARKPLDWKAYLMGILATAAFAYYIWRIFFKAPS